MLATDAAGNLLWKETYLPYGKKQTNEPASADNRIGYAGKPYDTASGLSYMGARYYDPLTGRFTGVDPKGFDQANLQSFNRYAYANNNPYKFVDPDGRIAIFIGGAMDSVFKPVLGFYESYKANNPNCAYFGWSQSGDIQKLINSLPDGEPINLIGHSLGGATAADVAATSSRRIDNLITIDPVGGPLPNVDAIRKNTDMWINVNAAPTNPNFSDAVAKTGGKWGDSPRGQADSFITADQNHANFGRMMNTGGPAARTPMQILNGTSTLE